MSVSAVLTSPQAQVLTSHGQGTKDV